MNGLLVKATNCTMTPHEAIKFLSPIENVFSTNQDWADLGCGKGTFTRALAHVLEPGSTIYAIDSNLQSLDEIPGIYNGLMIKKINADFIKDDLQLEMLDGILMANALHFVEDKVHFVSQITKYLNPYHTLIIVEYDTDKTNKWIPFPASFQTLKSLFHRLHYDIVLKIHQHPSIYQNANLYSAICRKSCIFQ